MSHPGLPSSMFDMLRCQQSLERLVASPEGLCSPSTGLTYPVRDGLVFIGHDPALREYIYTVIDEEKRHQTSVQNVDRDAEFLRESARATAALIRGLRSIRPAPAGLRSLEVGAGSGWASYMLVVRL